MPAPLLHLADSSFALSEAFSPGWLLAVLVAGYLLGSLPFGWLVARAHGVNIFEVGSKSPGATNVRRTLGAAAGNLVFALDAIKGAAASGWPLLARLNGSIAHLTVAGDGSGQWADDFSGPMPYCLAGLGAALVGHSFSCFTGFKGGKGVATGAGGFAVLMPIVTLIAAAVWGLVFLTTRYVSLASIGAAVAMPTGSLLLHEPALLTIVAAIIGAFVIVRHRANVVRLLNGTENKSGRKPGNVP